MKKTIATALLLVIAAGFTAGAQDFTRKGGISINIGGEPALAGFNYESGSYDSQSLSGIYEPYTTSPEYFALVSLTGEYILGRLIGVGADVSWTGYTVNKYNGVTRKDLGQTTVNGIIFMPSVRAYWINRDRIKLYSGLYGGVSAAFQEGAETSFKPEAEVIYLGVRFSIFGKGRLYGMAETGFGTVMNGGRIGIGFGF